MKYPVRCCCQPTKILGHLEMPRDDYRNGEYAKVQVKHSTSDRSFTRTLDGPEPVLIIDPTAWFRRYTDLDSDISEIAVYSDDHPIEFWRKIVGFEEVVARAGLEPASPPL